MPKYSKDLNKAQMQLMGKKHELTLLNVTRWDRDIECLHNAVSVEPAADELCERVMAHWSFLAAQQVEDAGSSRLEDAATCSTMRFGLSVLSGCSRNMHREMVFVCLFV